MDSILYREGPLANDRPHSLLPVLEARVRRELATDSANARLWLVLAELRNGSGDLLGAQAAAARALALGADSALALRVQAESMLRRSDGAERGLELYERAVSHLTRASAGRFRADIAPLMTDVEAEWWSSSGDEERRRWLLASWEHRAALAGVAVADRVAEHYRRMAAAAEQYEPVGTGSGGGANADVLWREDYRRLPYDERGLVYVRRGPPLEVLRSHVPIGSSLPNLAWVYVRVDGSVDLFHFSKGRGAGTSYRVVTPPASCGPSLLPRQVVDAAQAAVESGWVMEGAPMRGELNRALVSCFTGSPDDWRTRRINSRMNALAQRQVVAEALEQESPRPPFEEGVPALFDFYTFRGAGGGTDVVAAFAVPLEPAEPMPLRLTATVADETGGVIRRVGSQARGVTVVQPAIRETDGRAWGFAYLPMQVQPTPEASYRVVLEDTARAGRGGMWGGQLEVPAYGGGALMLSDVIVTGTGPALWQRGDVSLPLQPARSFEPGEAVVLFYEVYNVPAGEPFRTQIEVRREREGLGQRLLGLFGGGSALRLAFNSTAPQDSEGTVQEVRTLQTQLEPGTYRVRVRLTDGRGGEAERERELIIEERSE